MKNKDKSKLRRFFKAILYIIKSFFGIKPKDRLRAEGLKVAGLAIRRIIYTIADYWLAGLSAALVIAMRAMGFSFLYCFIGMWIYDFSVAAVFLVIYLKTGKDLSLGEDYRRAADAILEKSKLAGWLSFSWVTIQAIAWTGPEQVLIFFRKEIGSNLMMTIGLTLLTGIQALIWTSVYLLGYESVSELVKHFIR